MGVRTGDGRVTWYGLTLAAGFGDVAPPAVVEAAAADAGVSAPVMVEGDPIVPVLRRSRQGGWLVFTQNLSRQDAAATLRPAWPVSEVRDLIADAALAVDDNGFQVTMEPWSVGVFHCNEA